MPQSPTESSRGTYCGSDAKVNGKSIGSCLGDFFSLAWLEESDVTDLTKESLDTQFGKIKTRTTKSKVMQWGDLSFKTDMASEFIGTTDGETEQLEQTEGSAISWNARQLDLQQAYYNYVSTRISASRSSTQTSDSPKSRSVQRPTSSPILRI